MVSHVRGLIRIVGRMAKSSLLGAVLLAVCGGGGLGVSAQAQDPDYSNVDDILNSRRTMLAIHDLVIAAYWNQGVDLYQATTDNSKIAPSYWTSYYYEGGDIIPKALSGYMFDLPTAVNITLFPGLPDALTPPDHTVFEFPIIDGIISTGAMADFTQDGYDDLIVNFTEGQMIVVTAADVHDRGKGYHFGPVSTLDVLQEMAVGDFNGDEQPEIAGLSQLPSGGLALGIYTVDPKTLTVARAAQVTLDTPGASASEPVTHLSIASGRFTASAHDQLVVTFATANGQARLATIDFEPSSLQPQEKSALQTVSQPRPDGMIKVKTGKFNYPSERDQVVFLFAWHGASTSGTKYLDLMTVEPDTLAITRHDQTRYDFSGIDCAYDLAVGNFDHRQPDPSSPGQTEHNPKAQIALAYGNCGFAAKDLNILNVDATSFTFSEASVNTLDLHGLSPLSIVQADLQGRSYVLGAPTKVVIDGTTQPSVTVAMPPMHVDFMPPAGEKAPKVLNVSAIPDGFNTAYATEDSASSRSSTTNGTSWSFGAAQTLSASLEVGSVTEGEGIEAKETIKAAADLKGNIENEHGSYSHHDICVSQETGFADQVWFTASRFNIYVYPVLGKKVCPATKPNCQDSEKVQLTVQFSGPDHTSSETVAGNLLAWYQPPWEYGNVLSYPGSYSQLQQIFPGIDKLSTDLTWATDSSNFTEKTTWVAGTTGGSTTSFDQNYSFETDTSVSGKGGIGNSVTFGFGIDLDVSGSFGFSTLIKSVTDLEKTTGIGVKKPGSFLDPENYG